MRVIFGAWFLLLPTQLCIQAQPLPIQEVIDRVDSIGLKTTVEELSGERALPGTSIFLVTRYWEGRDLARSYLLERLQGFGLQAVADTFPYGSSWWGANVIAEQQGSREPGLKVIIGAHFDAEEENGVGPGADDNASGCAAVLEAARLLSAYQSARTITYALWDLEESGLQGSASYARRARARGDSIVGVINLDVIGFDGNNDQIVNIFTGPTAKSWSMADSVTLLAERYSVGVHPTVAGPPTLGSDHRSFWQYGYSAVCFTEDFRGGDVNHQYGTANDRVGLFNMRTFTAQTRLAVAAVAWMAEGGGSLSVEAPGQGLPGEFALFQNYPNPSNSSTTIQYALPSHSHVRLTVYSTLGQVVREIVNGDVDAGYHEVQFKADRFASGVYLYRLQAGSFVETKKLLLLR